METISQNKAYHFSGQDNLPTQPEVLSLVTNHLPFRENAVLGLDSKEWNEVHISDEIVREAGAKDHHDFADRLSKLPENLKNLVCNQVYDFPFAEKIQRIFQMNFEERKELFYNSFQSSETTNLDEDYLNILLRDSGMQALMEKLITPEQAAAMPLGRLNSLLNDRGLQALREKLITVEKAAAMSWLHLDHLLTACGVQVLREKLITPEQAAAMPSGHLGRLLEWHGIQALRDKLISPEQAAAMSWHHLNHLLTPNGMQALGENLITPEQAAAEDSATLGLFLNREFGIQALRELRKMNITNLGLF